MEQIDGSIVTAATSTPEEAAQNLRDAAVLDMDPTAYKKDREIYKPMVERATAPAATPGVQAFMQTGAEKAAAVKEDVSALSRIEKIVDYGKRQIFGIPDLRRQAAEFGRKAMWDPEALSERDLEKWNAVNEDMKLMGEEDSALNLSPAITYPAQAISALADMGRALWDKKALVATSTVTGAGLGAVAGGSVGAVAGPAGVALGARSGAMGGARTGFSVGFRAATMVDTFQQTSGNLYTELTFGQDDNGQQLNIDHETKRNLSLGVGVSSAALDVVFTGALAKSTPWLAKYIKPGAKEWATAATNTVARQAMINIGKAASVGATTEGLQEIAQIIGEEIGIGFDPQGDEAEVKFANGLSRAAERLTKNLDQKASRVADAAIVGGLLGFGIAGTTNVLGRKTIAEQVEFMRKANTDATAVEVGAVVDRGPVRPADQGGPDIPQALLPPPSDITDAAPATRAQQGIDGENMLIAIAKESKNTKVFKAGREQLQFFREQILRDSGITDVWVDREELNKFVGDDPEKLRMVRQMLDPSSQDAAAYDAPVRINSKDWVNLMDEYPDAAPIAKLGPEKPSGNEARALADALAEAEGRRKVLLAKIDENDPAKIASSSMVDVADDNATLISKIKYQEAVDAWQAQEIQRRYENEVAIEETLARGEEPSKYLKEFTKNSEQLEAKMLLIKDGLPMVTDTNKVLNDTLDIEDTTTSLMGYDDYINQPTFTENIESVTSNAKVKKINAAQKKAKTMVVESIKEAEQLEMNKLVDIVEEQAIETQIEIEDAKLKNDPNVAVVESFINSSFRIDPNSVPDNLKKYLTDPQLKKHKAFKKGGLTLAETAPLMGVQNGKMLLRILSKTPSKAEIIEAEVARREESIALEARRSVNPNETAVVMALNDVARNHRAEMEYMKTEEWTATKAGVKTIALPVPRIEDIDIKARDKIGSTIVAHLNVNQWKVGERKAQRKALDQILKNDVEAAFINKEKAIANALLAKHTSIAFMKLNRGQRAVRKIMKKKNMDILKRAGAMDAMNEILDVINLLPKDKQTVRQNSYNKWVKRMVKEGNGDFQVADGFFDARGSIKELTVDQAQAVLDTAVKIFHQAKMKDQLLTERKKANMVQTASASAMRIAEVAKTSPEYDVRKLEETPLNPTVMDAIVNWGAGGEALVTNIRFQALRIDNYKPAGVFDQEIVQRIEGTGAFEGQGGIMGANADAAAAYKAVQTLVAKHIPNFDQYGFEVIDAPELATNPYFKNTRKIDILMMALHLGNEGNREALSNFGKSADELQAITEKYLTLNDFKFVQGIWDMYKANESRVIALEKDTTGIEPEMVESKPFRVHGFEFRGGYFPIKYLAKKDSNVTSQIREIQDTTSEAIDNIEDQDKQAFYVRGMTRQGHLIARQGSDRVLNLSVGTIVQGFDQLFSDLNMRKPVRDALNILSHPDTIENAIPIIGKDNFNMVVDTVTEAANARRTNDVTLFQDSANFAQKSMAYVESAQSTTYLVGNLGTVLMQFMTLPVAVEKMGMGRGTKHLLATLSYMVRNPKALPEVFRVAQEANPNITNYLQNIDDRQTMAMMKLMPQKSVLNPKTREILSPITGAQDYINEKGFELLGFIDIIQKTWITLAAKRQFMSGEAPGWTKEEVNALSTEEREKLSNGYAVNVVATTTTSGGLLDRAPIQKLQGLRWFAKYWNDARNVLNSQVGKYRYNREKMKSAIRDAKTGNYKSAAKQTGEVGYDYMTAVIISSLSLSMAAAIRGIGREEEEEEALSFDTKEQALESMMILAKKSARIGFSPVERMAENTPIVRDIKYAMGRTTGNSDTKAAGLPLTSAMTTMATAGAAVPDVLSVMSEYLGMVEATDAEISRTEGLALGQAASYATRGFPVNGIFKMYDFLGSTFDTLEDDYITWSERSKDLNTQIEDVKKLESVPQEFKDELQKIQEDVLPEGQPGASRIPDETSIIIGQIESGNKWWAKNPKSTAAGKYQFLEGTWADIMEKAPELELTDEGRTSKDTTQQEAAMQWFMERNADILEAAKIPVTNESLYASHFLGGRAAVKVLGSFDNVKIKTLVGKNVMTANDFKASMTVKEFKAWVSKKINNAFDAIAKGIPEDDAEAPADTTPPVSNVEGDTNAAEL